jgi:hypothetical protein
MKLLFGIIAGFWILSSVANVAAAGTYDVSAGHSRELAPLGGYDPQRCAALAPPTYTIAQPAHGTLKVVNKTIVFNRGICKGKRFKVMMVVYSPNRGFRGKDRGSVTHYRSMYTDRPNPKIAETISFVLNVK